MTPHRDEKGRFTRRTPDQDYEPNVDGGLPPDKGATAEGAIEALKVWLDIDKKVEDESRVSNGSKIARELRQRCNNLTAEERLDLDERAKKLFAKKPADDLDEDTQAFGEAVARWDIWGTVKEFGLCLLLVILGYVIGTVNAVNHLSAKEAPDMGTPISAPAITAPALAVDPHLNLAFPAPTPQPLIIVGPFQVRGWKDGEPILFEAQ